MLTNNAISWAHFQLRGGWKSLLITAGSYGAAILVLIFITTRMNPRGTTSTTAGWASALMGLQAAALLLFAGSRISNAIRNDLNSSIIESHRLMPLPPSQAVIGYMTGPAAQAIGVVGVNLILGVGMVSMASLGLGDWFAANFVMICFAGFIWCVLVLMSFVTRKAFGGIGWVIGLTVFGFTSQGMITMLFPGLAVLVSPVMGQSVFSLRPGSLVLGSNYALAIAGQGTIGAICFIGAARKYRRADEAAFTPFMGLLLLVAWVGVSLVGMSRWGEVAPWFFRRSIRGERGILEIQFIASILMSMLLALIAIAAGVREHADFKRRQRLNDPALESGSGRGRKRLAPPTLIALLAAGLCLCLLLASPEPADFTRATSRDERVAEPIFAIAVTTAVVVSFAMTISFVLRILNRGGSRRAGVLVGLLIPFLWLAPLLADVVRWAAQQDENANVLSQISTASPIGALVMTWGRLSDRDRVSPAWGVAAQVALAVALTMQYYTAGRAGRSRVPAE